MVTLIRQLIARGHAYEAEGEVLFDVQSMPDYGALSGRKLDEQRSRARASLSTPTRRVRSISCCGSNRPAMSRAGKPMGQGPPGLAHRVLGDGRRPSRRVFDIHGGGIDLVFPHHENELAQIALRVSRHARDGEFWMHNGFLQVEDDKMSKSLGNFVTIRDLLADWPGEVLRLNMLKTHYRSPIEWTLKGLEESTRTLDDWYAVAADAEGGAAVRCRVRSAFGRSEHAADDRRVARLCGIARPPEPEAIAASLPRPCGCSVSCPRARRNGAPETAGKRCRCEANR